MYCIYRAFFRTERGTYRAYVGHTGSLEERKRTLRTKPPDWLKPGVGSVDVLVVEEGIASKSVALVLEAMHAARAICSRPHTCRGGPWSSPRALSDAALRDVAAVARCRSLTSIWDIARQRKGGALWKHLEDLAFTAASDAPSSAVVVRGAWVHRIKRSGRSGASGPSGQSGRSGASGPSGRGTPGNKHRRKLVLARKLKRTDLKHKQLHRGRVPTVRRQAETLNRGGRR